MNRDALPDLERELLSVRNLVDLASSEGGPHVSIYMPTEMAGPAVRENPIRLKNLVTSAEEQLSATGMRPTLARDLMAPARELVDNYDFWQRQSLGLALHLNEAGMQRHRLPLQFPELAIVSDRFIVRPLLPLFVENAYFYLLALSMNDVRFLRCTRYGEQEVEVAGMPRRLTDVTWPEEAPAQHQFRAMGRASGHHYVTHNSEDRHEQQQEQLADYFRAIDNSLQEVLAQERAPLVLACVAEHRPIYREVSNYQHIVDAGVELSPDRISSQELRERGWEIVEPIVKQAELDAIARYQQEAGTGRTGAGVEEVVREAGHGRVDSLLIAGEEPVWGRLDGDRVVVHAEPEPGDQDLVDLAAVRTLENGGEIHFLDEEEMPVQAPVAALYRY